MSFLQSPPLARPRRHRLNFVPARVPTFALALVMALAVTAAALSSAHHASAAVSTHNLAPTPAIRPDPPSLNSAAAHLTANLHSIQRPGVPGYLVLTRADAAPVVLADAGRGVLAPVVAIGALGHGRVAAYAHTGYLSADTLRDEHTAALLDRTIRWAAQAPTPTPAADNTATPSREHDRQAIRVGLLGVNLAPFLRERNFEPINLGPATNKPNASKVDSNRPDAGLNALAVALNDCDAVLLSTSLSDADERALLEWVERRAGGLIVAATGWGYLQLNPAKTIDDLTAHRLATHAGIAFTSETVSGPSGEPFTIHPQPIPFTNAAQALTALAAHARGDEHLAAPDLKQAAGSAMLAARAVSPSDAQAAAMLDELTANQPPPEIRPASPLRASDHLNRVRAAWFTRKWDADAILAHLNSTTDDSPAIAERTSIPIAPGANFFPGGAEIADGSGAPDATTIARTTRQFTFPRDPLPGAERAKGDAGWISTGLYALPGEVIIVQTDGDPQAARIRIGCHSDHLYHLDQWRRWPEVSLTFPLRSGRMRIASPFGGLIYLDSIPRAINANANAPLRISIADAVPAPRFVLDQTTAEQWRNVERSHPAPWAELEGRRVILSLPSEVVRTLDDPEALMRHWDSIADACADLAQRPRHRDKPERIVADVQISAGYMHSGYPIMTHLDAARVAVDLPRLASTGSWGHYHELGHNHQSDDWTFEGTTEVTVNLFTLYAIETICGKTIPEIDRFSPADRDARTTQFFDKGNGTADFNIWKNDPFLALEMYIQMREAFGWDAFKTVFREYRDLPRDQRPKSDAEKRDQWLVRFSRTVGQNLGPFFQSWGIPTSAAARESIAELPIWMPKDFLLPSPPSPK